MELHIDASRAVLEAFDAGALDAAIVLGHDAHRRDGDRLLEEPFGWMAAPDFHRQPGEPLRLATQAEPCSVRTMAIGVLDAAGVPWTEVFVGGGIAAIGAAVSAGLAVAALARRVAPSGTIDVGRRLGLPGRHAAFEAVRRQNTWSAAHPGCRFRGHRPLTLTAKQSLILGR